MVLFLQALGPYAQARASRRTRTASKEETTHAHDHFAMFHMDQVHPLRRSAAARFLYTLPLTTTNASFVRSRRTPMPPPCSYTLHPTPPLGSAHPFADPRPLPPQAAHPPTPACPSPAPLPLPKLRVVRYACDVYHRQTDEVELSGCGRVNERARRVLAVCAVVSRVDSGLSEIKL